MQTTYNTIYRAMQSRELQLKNGLTLGYENACYIYKYSVVYTKTYPTVMYKRYAVGELGNGLGGLPL